ncbi:MAG: type IV pilin protein [Gemmatimonadota bacterium]
MDNANPSRGFTLVELLIVVVVIGILAMIAIPRFASTKGKGYDAAAKTDLRNAMTAQEAYYADYQTYASDDDLLKGGGYFRNSSDVGLSIFVGNTSMYKMTTRHEQGSRRWCINSTAGEIMEGDTC